MRSELERRVENRVERVKEHRMTHRFDARWPDMERSATRRNAVMTGIGLVCGMTIVASLAIDSVALFVFGGLMWLATMVGLALAHTITRRPLPAREALAAIEAYREYHGR